MAGQQESKDTYLKEKVETFVVRVPKGQKNRIQQFAKENSRSLNSFIVELINIAMEGNLSIKPAYTNGNDSIQAIDVSDSQINLTTFKDKQLDEMTAELIKAFQSMSFVDKMEIMNAVLEKTKMKGNK
ncbi:MAG: Arc family DNA-binding protein [Oscillospiraceae bacterium]|nr:Arc family DNA-binding protein [Oscillospiraceae bacterium]